MQHLKCNKVEFEANSRMPAFPQSLENFTSGLFGIKVLHFICCKGDSKLCRSDSEYDKHLSST